MPNAPIYLMGYRSLELRRHRHTLGSGSQAITAATSAAPKLATAISSSSWAGPIGVGIAVIGSLIGGLWAAHAARAKGAKNENAAANSAIQAFDSSIRAIFDAANSNDPNKYIDAQTAIQALQQTLQAYWAAMAQYSTAPGTHDESNHGANCAAVRAKATPCDKKCTAGCCGGCVDLEPSILDAIAVFQQGGGTVKVRKVFGSKYGGQERAGYTLTYAPNPPAAVGTIDSLTAAITGSGGHGSSSLLLPLLGIGLAFLFLR